MSKTDHITESIKIKSYRDANHGEIGTSRALCQTSAASRSLHTIRDLNLTKKFNKPWRNWNASKTQPPNHHQWLYAKPQQPLGHPQRRHVILKTSLERALLFVSIWAWRTGSPPSLKARLKQQIQIQEVKTQAAVSSDSSSSSWSTSIASCSLNS